MVGSVIENYKVVSVLGEGGMGVVYKALDMKLERFVALKILASSSLNNPQFIERFKREARNQAKLTHPNIVPVYGFTDENGVLGIAMEYVEGETLEKLIYRKKRLEVPEALGLTKQILAGVGYAHSKGFIHRDIKPSNIIINKEGMVKIMDFGISKSIFEKGITKTGTKIGTILYMSPEQIRAEEPTRQSDIYSIGVTMYEMLLGKTPFDYGTEYEIMEGHLKKTPARVSLSLNSAPPEVDKIVAKALEKTVPKRYKNCEEFTEELDEIIKKVDKGKPSVKTGKPVKDAEPGQAMHKVKVTLLTVAILAMFIGLAYVIFNALSSIWPTITKNKGHEADTLSGIKKTPGFVEKANWMQLTTGVTQTLNAISFFDDYSGIACGERGTVIKTTDGGSSWRVIAPFDSVVFNDISFNSPQSAFIVGEGGRVYRSTDLGETWSAVPLRAQETLFRLFFINYQVGFIAGSKGLILRTTDGGATWNQVRAATNNLLYSISFAENSLGFAVGWNGTVIKSTDAGATWAPVKSFTDKYLRDIAFRDKSTCFVSAAGGEIFKSADRGETWTPIQTKALSGLTAVDFVNEYKGFACSNKGEIVETNDGGDTWNSNPSGNYFSLSRIAVTPKQKVFIAGFNGIILKTKD